MLLGIRALNSGVREGAETTDFLPVCDTNYAMTVRTEMLEAIQRLEFSGIFKYCPGQGSECVLLSCKNRKGRL